MAGQAYFSVFNQMIAGDRESFHFGGRSRRPPLDRVNALLSFVYALLRHDIESALESVGLDPVVGFLHTDRPGRPSLALDPMEELRAALADRLVLTLINRRQIQGERFSEQDGGGIQMDDETRKQVVSAWQLRKQDEIELRPGQVGSEAFSHRSNRAAGDADEAEVVRMIFLMSGTGKKSCRKIADHLTGLGIACSSAEWVSGKQAGKHSRKTASIWRSSHVRNMLASRTYMGQHCFGKRSRNQNRKVIVREVPAIVSEPLWEAVRNVLRSNQIMSTRNNGSRTCCAV